MKTIAGIDPGYATGGVATLSEGKVAGAVSVFSLPPKISVEDTHKTYKLSEYITERAAARRCAVMGARFIASILTQVGHAVDLLVVEEWKTDGPRAKPRTTYYRGMNDSAINNYAAVSLPSTPILWVPPMWVRQFSNAGGAAVPNKKAPKPIEVLSYLAVSMPWLEINVKDLMERVITCHDALDVRRDLKATDNRITHAVDALVMAAIGYIVLDDSIDLSHRPVSQQAIVGFARERLHGVQQQRSD